MNDQAYTAEELRAQADSEELVKGNCETIEMLRYAADMAERYEKMESKCNLALQEIDAKRRHIEGLVTNTKNLTICNSRKSVKLFAIEKIIKEISDNPEYEDAMPAPWSWRASKWGIRDIDIYDANNRHITCVTECYPTERMASATMIPLAVNAIQKIKTILRGDEGKEKK